MLLRSMSASVHGTDNPPPSGRADHTQASGRADHTQPSGRADARQWSVRLLGSVEAESAGQTITRWPTRAVAALLARLALAPGRAHAREELIELLWPGAAPEAGRNRLRQALSTLKSLLETRDQDAAPVLVADRITVRVAPGAMRCDVAGFERAARSGDVAAARALYRGELMPGFYDEWVLGERARLLGLYERSVDPMAAAELRPVAPTAGRSLGAAGPTSGLPSYLTRAFGLEMIASRLRALVLARRLITVHGPGGSGKTRLAAEVAQSLGQPVAWPAGSAADSGFDRVVFVPLVSCVSAEQALDAIAEALAATGSGDARSRIVTALSGRRALLVLDNAEQLDREADACFLSLLGAVPALHLVVTSRRLLDLDGEVAFEADGLPLPSLEARAGEALDNAAVALFVDRARAVRNDFQLDRHNADEVIALVRLLGGMPLAIELAASRLRSHTPSELLLRLADRAGSPTLDLLARGATRASADVRHASMRHVVSWSWQQLSPPQVAMMRALSIFSAPALRQTIAAVAGMAEAQAGQLLDALRDTSLLRIAAGAGQVTRQSLLQPVREFAAEQCAPDEASGARHRLRRWLIEFAAQAVRSGPAAVAPELPHVHAAIVSGPPDGAAADALRLAIALRPYWDIDSLPLSTMLALEEALRSPSIADDTALRSDAHELLSIGHGTAGDAAQSLRHAEAAITLAPDARRRSVALTRWAAANYFGGRYGVDFEAALDEAEQLAAAQGDAVAEANALHVRAILASNLRLDFAAAEQLAERAQELFESAGNRHKANFMLLSRATMWAWQGRNAEALAVMQACEQPLHDEGDWVGLMHNTRQQGRILIRMRRWSDAVAAFRRSLRVCWLHQHMQCLSQSMLHLPEALLHGAPQELETAAKLQGFVVPYWSRLYPRLNRIEMRELVRARRMMRLHLGPARAETLRLAGSGLSLPEAVALALGEATNAACRPSRSP